MSATTSTTTSLDLGRSQHVHIVGLGGAGMSAIAAVLLSMGQTVSGSDLKDSSFLERLRALGVAVHVGHDAANIAGADVLAISSAVPAINVEVKAAKDAGVPVLRRSQVLTSITKAKPTIAVAGTHGKTTTTSMLALILIEAGMRPSFIVGGEVNEIGTNAAWAAGDWFVVEADESDGTFLDLDSTWAIVTSVEPDHLEHYGDFASLQSAFERFCANAQGAVVCADDPGARRAGGPNAITYGFSSDAEFRIVDFVGARSAIGFSIARAGQPIEHFELPVPGEHNALNAAAAIALSSQLGVGPDEQRRALARFAGVARRFEFRGERHGVVFVDDYAHLPGEISATLHAAKQGNFDRIVAVFQPHRYSRIAALAPSFADAFMDADVVVFTGIYGAGEPVRPGVSTKLILDAVLAKHPRANVDYVFERSELAKRLKGLLKAGDLCICLGAGDLTTLPDELLGDSSW